jgi:hypothetical protein
MFTVNADQLVRNEEMRVRAARQLSLVRFSESVQNLRNPGRARAVVRRQLVLNCPDRTGDQLPIPSLIDNLREEYVANAKTGDDAASATLDTMAAMEAYDDDDHEAAAEAHRSAAEQHEDQATAARKAGDSRAATLHDRAAALHRRLASQHDAADEEDEATANQLPLPVLNWSDAASFTGTSRTGGLASGRTAGSDPGFDARTRTTDTATAGRTDLTQYEAGHYWEPTVRHSVADERAGQLPWDVTGDEDTLPLPGVDLPGAVQDATAAAKLVGREVDDRQRRMADLTRRQDVLLSDQDWQRADGTGSRSM